MTTTKTCRTCGVIMENVATSRVYCMGCAHERALAQAKAANKKSKGQYNSKHRTYINSVASEYERITGRKRHHECDGSGFF